MITIEMQRSEKLTVTTTITDVQHSSSFSSGEWFEIPTVFVSEFNFLTITNSIQFLKVSFVDKPGQLIEQQTISSGSILV